MALRKVSLDHLREIVRARITKGDGFRLSYEEYLARQHEVKTALAEMSREEIIRRWPHHCYDIKG